MINNQELGKPIFKGEIKLDQSEMHLYPLLEFRLIEPTKLFILRKITPI